MTDKILNWLFDLITGECNYNWVNIRYSKFNTFRKLKNSNRFRDYKGNNVEYFKVPGGGEIALSKSCHHHCGGVVGFGFDVEWATYGFNGGVLGRDEAIRMANFILEKCSETTETMEEEINRF